MLRVLLVEDNPLDAELVEHQLEAGGFGPLLTRVDEEDAFRSALAEPALDLILADLHLRRFSGTEALEIARAQRPDVPFIFVSGTPGEEAAVEAVRSGATDYVLKDHLSRLEAAVSRALRESAAAREHERLGAELARLASFPELNPNIVLEVDVDGRVTYINPSSRERFPDLEREGRGHPLLADLVREDGGPGLQIGTFEVTAGPSAFILNVSPVLGSEGTVRVYAVEITEQRRAEEQLRVAEEQYRTLVEQLPAITYVNDSFGATGGLRYVSPQVEAILGFSPQEWGADRDFWWIHAHPDDREAVAVADARSRETGTALDIEYRMIAKDGHVVWFHDLATVLLDPDGRPLLVHGVMFDVTESKEAKDHLEATNQVLRRTDVQRRFLLAKLITAQEEERMRLANDIHDDPVQVMTAVSIRLGMLRDRLPADAAEELAPVETTVREALGRLRGMLFKLRPSVLDSGGLIAAIEEYADRLSEEVGPRVSVEHDLRDPVSPEVRILVYRLMQEAVANARKHAAAKHIRIDVRTEGGGVRTVVTDDGVGFDLPVVASGRDHIGLASMRERAEMSGGTFDLQSTVDSGTDVSFWIPLARRDPSRDATDEDPASALAT